MKCSEAGVNGGNGKSGMAGSLDEDDEGGSVKTMRSRDEYESMRREYGGRQISLCI